MFLFAILSTVIHIASSATVTNCSALHAFIEVKGDGISNNTLTSAQALFPPHSYYVPWTELVQLSIDDDPCDDTATFTTDVTDKIVLLFEDIGDCSVHYKVLVAESNGAIAVLMSNTDLTGSVVSIVDDNDLTGLDPIIPMRSISKSDADILSDEITADRGVEIQIGCFNTTYPSIFCLSDSTGGHSSLAGNYQRQEQRTMNGHPIWKNPGQRDYKTDLHIFLHDAHGDGEWYWAVTYDELFKYDSWLMLICGEQGPSITHPGLCPVWHDTKDWGESWNPYVYANVTEGLCDVPVADELVTLCVDSYQHTIAGIRGTYTLTASGTPEWWRELTDCDERAGQIVYIGDGYYGNGYFVVYEPLNSWIISLCIIAEELSENGTYATMKWRPDLCTDWVTRNDYDLTYSASHRYSDPTYNISLGACSAERSAVHNPDPCVPSDPSDTLCLTNNSIIHGFLMGEYTFLPNNETGPYYDSAMYERIDYYDPFSTNVSGPYYIWYANEFTAQVWGIDDYIMSRDWIITDYSLEQAINESTYYYYGHCSGWSYGDPAQCQGWVFYAGEAFHYDEQMRVSEGECDEDENPIPSIPETWPDYVCIGLINESLPYGAALSTLHSNSFAVGAFSINRSFVDEDNPVPEWMKLHNDLEYAAMWLYFWDTHWYVANISEHVMVCDPYSNADSVNPLDCKTWYDGDWNILDNVFLEECSADDVITASPTESPTQAPTSSPTPNERICFSRNGTVSSLLEGIYVDNGLNYDEYGTVEFVSVTTDVDDDTPPLYIWYHDNGWWVSPVDYKNKSGTDESVLDVYAFCRGGERGIYPICEDDWTFFWDVHPLSLGYDSGKKVEDSSFVLSNDLSGCDDEGEVVFEYPEKLCLNAFGVNDVHHDHPYDDLDDVPTFTPLTLYLGEYELVEGGVGYDTYYVHKDTEELLLRHNLISNHWYIGISPDPMHIDMLCRGPSGHAGHNHGDDDDQGEDEDEDNEEGIPSVCLAWDSNEHEAVYVDNLISFARECISEGKITKINGGKVAGTVIGILLGIICCGVIVFLWLKFNRDKTHQPVVRESVDHEQEMGTLAPTAALTAGGEDKKALGTHTGQETYDMEALNAREDEDDDADPLTTE